MKKRIVYGLLLLLVTVFTVHGLAATVTITFLSPETDPISINQHYPLDTYYADKPLKYFSNSDPDFLQNQLYAKVRAESSSESGPDLDGKFNFDIPGTLSGNWWLKTVSYFTDDEYGRRQLPLPMTISIKTRSVFPSARTLTTS